jgi:hypothetical protein
MDSKNWNSTGFCRNCDKRKTLHHPTPNGVFVGHLIRVPIQWFYDERDATGKGPYMDICGVCYKHKKYELRKEALKTRKALTELGVCSDIVALVRGYITTLPQVLDVGCMSTTYSGSAWTTITHTSKETQVNKTVFYNNNSIDFFFFFYCFV